MDLSDEQIDALMVAIRSWCDAAWVKPGSRSAQPVIEYAIDLVAGIASFTPSEQLLEKLVQKFPP
jgi:hypothetical protein